MQFTSATEKKGSLAFVVAGVVGFFAALFSSNFSLRKSIGMLIPVVI